MSYSVAKPVCPFAELAGIIELEKLHGVDFFPNSSHENERTCRDFIGFCAKGISKIEINKKINFNSNICHEELIQQLVNEKESIYVLPVDSDDFEVRICLLSLQSLGSQDANGIFSARKITFSGKDLRKAMVNVVLLVSDGVSVNAGLKNSLIKLFRDKIPLVGFLLFFK